MNRAALVALTLLSASGCKKVCDEEALTGVAATLEKRTASSTREGLTALHAACPRLPSVLKRSLDAAHEVMPLAERAAYYREREADSTFGALAEQTCPGRASGTELPAGNRDEAVRAWCEVDRLGVIGTDEPFVMEDLEALRLYVWMTANDVDNAVARRVTRALMVVGATPAQREVMCLTRGDACHAMFSDVGVEPPRSTSDAPKRAADVVRITRTQVVLGERAVLTLTDGHPEPGTFDMHVASAMLSALEARAEAGRLQAEAGGSDWDEALALLVDATLSYGLLADVMFTARKAGYTNFELLTSDGHTLASITLSVPPSWNDELRHRPHGAPGTPRVDLHVDSLEAGAPDQASDKADDATLSAFVADTKTRWPHETVVRLSVDRDVPIQRLVTVLDTLRGEHCKLLGALEGEELPSECAFFQPIVNTSPPLFWAVDRLDGFELGEATASREGKGGPNPKTLLAAYDAHRAEIRDCLVKVPHFMEHVRDGDTIHVELGRTPQGEASASILHWGPVPPEVRDCVLEPLGVEPGEPRRSGPVEHQVHLGIEVKFPGAPGPGK